MRTYYVFNINNYFSYIYKKKPYKIYKMLESIMKENAHDMVLSYKLFEQIALSFNKNKLNAYFKFNYESNPNYYYKDNIHIIANNNEYTKLVITNSNIKIKTNINFSIFLKSIYEYQENIFICDFVNKDYFWWDSIEKSKKELSKT